VTPEIERESFVAGLRLVSQAEWARRFPRLVQGIAGRSPDIDFAPAPAPAPAPARLEAAAPAAAGGAHDGWQRLQQLAGIPAVARCRQIHSARVAVCADPLPPGIHVLDEADALVTRRRDILLAVTVADCVPIFIVDPGGVLGLAHAGWRGIAAGIVEATLDRMRDLGVDRRSLHVHLGPAICGECYEVGPEVLHALGLDGKGHAAVDLRTRVGASLAAAGVPPERVSVSPGCTRCEPGRFYSYRGGDRGKRMCAYLGGWPR
jgi:YfiH family protein